MDLYYYYVIAADIGITDKAAASNFMIASMVLFIFARFITTALMKYYSPAEIMKVLSLIAVLFASIAVFAGGWAGCIAIVGISGCVFDVPDNLWIGTDRSWR